MKEQEVATGEEPFALVRKALRSADGFEAWLRKHSPSMLVGRVDDVQFSPIARWLKGTLLEAGHERVTVYVTTGEVCVSVGALREVFPTPLWVASFELMLVKYAESHGREWVSAATALQVLYAALVRYGMPGNSC